LKYCDKTKGVDTEASAIILCRLC